MAAVVAAALGRQLLLVLDNCEHVTGAAAQLCAGLVAACDDVRVLATSREPLAVAGEARYRLAPLTLPAPGDPAGAARCESVALYADRARRANARFVLDKQTERAVARLDGLAPGRQRSLAATMEWSYLLLDEREQQVFRQVSVFPGPFTLEGAGRLRRAANDGDLGADAEQLCLLLDPLLDLFDPPHNQPAGDVSGRAAPGERPGKRFRRSARRRQCAQSHADASATSRTDRECAVVVGNRPKTVDGFALGDLVEIRSAEEILAGLDSRGEHDSLQFMPEMLQYCGRTFRIDKIAGKTCDTVNWSGMREMQNTVHLADVRCDGQAHGGCQAGCLIYWKTSWLKPAAGNSAGSGAPGVRTLPIAAVTQPEAAPRAACTPQRLAEVAHGGCRPAAEHAEAGETLYSCQATELPRAVGRVIPMHDARQYVNDVRYGNASAWSAVRGILVGAFNQFQDRSLKLPARLRIRGGNRYPFLSGTAAKGPVEKLDLQPGEWVRVKSAEEIEKTLNSSYRNRGLYFDREMLRYCGKVVQVHHRVNQIIDEPTGRMITMKTPCIILSNVVCMADFHRSCPRKIYTYWREIWLERVPGPVRTDGFVAAGGVAGNGQ